MRNTCMLNVLSSLHHQSAYKYLLNCITQGSFKARCMIASHVWPAHSSPQCWQVSRRPAQQDVIVYLIVKGHTQRVLRDLTKFRRKRGPINLTTRIAHCCKLGHYSLPRHRLMLLMSRPSLLLVTDVCHLLLVSCSVNKCKIKWNKAILPTFVLKIV
jgi:hypothetical protein